MPTISVTIDLPDAIASRSKENLHKRLVDTFRSAGLEVEPRYHDEREGARGFGAIILGAITVVAPVRLFLPALAKFMTRHNHDVTLKNGDKEITIGNCSPEQLPELLKTIFGESESSE